MSPKINRRELISGAGVLGAAAAIAALGPEAAGAGVELGRFTRRTGVQGKMTGAQAAAAALACEGVRCVFGIPGAQNNEFWDALKAAGVPYLLVAHEASASVMADAAARATGEVGVFSVVPGPGLTNAMTGIGEALYDSVPIVGIITDIDRSPNAPVGQVHGLANAAIVRPVVKALDRGPPPGRDPRAIFQAFRIADCRRAGPGRRADPVSRSTPRSGTTISRRLPPTPLRSTRRPTAGHCRCCPTAAAGSGSTPGWAASTPGPSLAAVAELLQAPVATSVSGKGCIPDAHPLAVGWGYGKQGTRAAEAAFKDVDLVLAVGVRYSEVSTANYAIPQHDALIHVDANPQNLGRNVHATVTLCSDARVFLDRLLARRRRDPPRPLPGTLAADCTDRARSIAARPRPSGSRRASTRCSS